MPHSVVQGCLRGDTSDRLLCRALLTRQPACAILNAPQCGQDKLGDIVRFKRIDGAAYTKEKDGAVAVSCGLGFSLILTRSGKGECGRVRCIAPARSTLCR